MTNGCVDK